MGGRVSPPGHLSAGVGQGPQTPPHAPFPAVHSLSDWYKIPGWSASRPTQPNYRRRSLENHDSRPPPVDTSVLGRRGTHGRNKVRDKWCRPQNRGPLDTRQRPGMAHNPTPVRTIRRSCKAARPAGLMNSSVCLIVACIQPPITPSPVATFDVRFYERLPRGESTPRTIEGRNQRLWSSLPGIRNEDT